MVRKRKLHNRVAELLAIKERREGRKITQRDIADEIGAALNTISGIMQNKPVSYLHRETIEKLMDYLDVDHDQFWETVVVEVDEDPETESTLTEVA